MKSIPLLVSVTGILSASQLFGGTTTIAPGPGPVMTTTSDNGWNFTLGLYGWGAGLDGDLGAGGYAMPVDISFSDILDTLDMTAMGVVEARKDRWLFQLEGLYLRNSVSGSAETPVRNQTFSADLVAKTTRLEAIAGYRLLENEGASLDLFAGAVYYDIDNELDIKGPNGSFSADSGDNWIDPVIGLRLRQQLDEDWCVQVRGEVGGFGVNSDLVWQALALVGYQITDSSTLFAGWRHAAVDYQNGGFLYDVYCSGPILGMTITW